MCDKIFYHNGKVVKIVFRILVVQLHLKCFASLLTVYDKGWIFEGFVIAN